MDPERAAALALSKLWRAEFLPLAPLTLLESKRCSCAAAVPSGARGGSGTVLLSKLPGSKPAHHPKQLQQANKEPLLELFCCCSFFIYFASEGATA